MGRLTKGALKLLLALACLLAALAALRGLVPPSLAQTVVWTQWTVVPAAELAKWRACTTAYALTGLVTTCGPPQNYTEAVWWAVTHGGTWPGGTVDAQTLSIVLSGGAIGLSLVAIVVAVAARR